MQEQESWPRFGLGAAAASVASPPSMGKELAVKGAVAAREMSEAQPARRKTDEQEEENKDGFAAPLEPVCRDARAFKSDWFGAICSSVMFGCFCVMGVLHNR